MPQRQLERPTRSDGRPERLDRALTSGPRAPLEVRKHLLRKRHCWADIACWIARGLRNIYGPDGAVFDEHGEAFATPVAEHGYWARVVEDQAKSRCELQAWIAEESDDGPLNPLLRSPGTHDVGIIHAVYKDVRDALLLQLPRLGEVSRNLLLGSGGCEGSGQAHKHDPFSLAELGQRQLPWRGGRVEADCWDLVACFGLPPRPAAACEPLDYEDQSGTACSHGDKGASSHARAQGRQHKGRCHHVRKWPPAARLWWNGGGGWPR